MADKQIDDTNIGAGRLVELDNSDFEVADGYPDPRGWDVLAGGTKVGEVKHLLADTDARRIRYLVVQLEDRVTNGDHDRQVLVPVGLARLNDDQDHVMLSGITTDRLASMTPYTGTLSRDHEDRTRTHLTGAVVPRTERDRDYYAHEHFDESRFFGDRGEHGEREARIPRVEEGDVRTREPAVAREAAAERTPVGEEEFIVRKRVVQESRPVEADVKRERIDVEKHGGAKDASRNAERRPS